MILKWQNDVSSPKDQIWEQSVKVTKRSKTYLKALAKVSSSHTIMEVKQILAMQVSIPVEEQKLVFKGKALVDDKRLSHYNIKEGDKLFLFLKKSDGGASPVVPVKSPSFAADLTSCTTTVLWDKLRVFLQRHFTPQDVEKVLIEFQKEFNANLQRLSLDDIERLASSKINQNGLAKIS